MTAPSVVGVRLRRLAVAGLQFADGVSLDFDCALKPHRHNHVVRGSGEWAGTASGRRSAVMGVTTVPAPVHADMSPSCAAPLKPHAGLTRVVVEGLRAYDPPALAFEGLSSVG